MFPITSSGEVTMIWATEDTGFRHLYLITSIITKVSHENGIQNVDPSESKYFIVLVMNVLLFYCFFILR